ncbi:hypothetical protein BH09VER1_BH09VER1_15480 [soil metagenome]
MPASLFAVDQKITFALPDVEGRISLGVFNVRGKLVRTLCVGAATADFTIGLNGLITDWDGKSEIGTVMPAGKYYVRGFVVGDAVKAEGEAYHFNDWIEDEKSPRIVKIEDFQKVERGFVLLARVLDEGEKQEAIRYDSEKGFVWAKAPVFKPSDPKKFIVFNSLNRLAVSDAEVVTLIQNTLRVQSLETGETLASGFTPSNGASAIAVSEKQAFVASNSRIDHLALPSLSPVSGEKVPFPFSSLAVAGAHRIGAADISEVWLAEGADWKKISTGIRAASVSFGVKDTFWLAGFEDKGGTALAGQFNFQGELLRAYRSDFEPWEVRASTQTEEISVLERKGDTQRLRQMSLVDRPGGGSDWEINFEKAVTPCGKFGVVDGALVADAGETPQRGTMEFPLATGGLTAEAPRLTVQLASDGSGLWLETASKLKLVKLADQTKADRFVLVPGENKASMTAYAGDGVVVAEYLITGLDAIAEIDAGEIEIP